MGQLQAEDPAPDLPDLPRAPPQPLTALALQTLLRGGLDAAGHERLLRQLDFDDKFVELASRRGLLVRFHVQPLWVDEHSLPEVEVEAPELMTVDFLKRRVLKALLLQGRFLHPKRLTLLSHAGLGEGDDLFEEVPSYDSSGAESFLAEVGFEAPGHYQLYMHAGAGS